MKKLLSIFAIAAFLVACGGEQKKSDDAEKKGGEAATEKKAEVAKGDNASSLLEQMKKHQMITLESLENNDYETFKANMLDVYNFTLLLQPEQYEQLMKDIEPFNNSLKERAEKYTTRAEEWSYTAAMELIEEGKIVMPE